MKKIKLADISMYEHLIPEEKYDVKVMDWIKEGWKLFAGRWRDWVLFGVIFVAVSAALAFIPIINFFSPVILMPLAAGGGIYALRQTRGEPHDFKTMFSGFGSFPQLALLGLVTSAFITIGFILLIVPGVYLSVAYFFAWLLVADRQIDFWKAMEVSRAIAGRNWFGLFKLCLLILVIVAAGAAAVLVGLVVALPTALCISAYAYEQIAGAARIEKAKKTEEIEEQPDTERAEEHK